MLRPTKNLKLVRFCGTESVDSLLIRRLRSAGLGSGCTGHPPNQGLNTVRQPGLWFTSNAEVN